VDTCIERVVRADPRKVFELAEAVEDWPRIVPRWPVPDALVRAVVGEYFVNGVARRTSIRIGQLAQRPS
jgi:hypothetical protein